MDTMPTKKYYVTIEVQKFKDILIHSWDLLPPEMQHELIEMEIYPRRQVPENITD